MLKFSKGFIKVVFWVLSVLFGVILVLTLPYLFLNTQLANTINDRLEEKQYVNAMNLIGCYYDSEIAYLYEDAQKDVQLVLFRATPFIDTTFEKVDDAGNKIEVVSQETIELGYFGFLCNISDKYETNSSKETEDFENKTKLVVNDTNNIFLLDYDESQNGKADSIITTLMGSYISFHIPMGFVDEVSKLEFIDKNGNVFLSVNTKNSTYGKLDFNHDFFKEFKDFISEYNKLKEEEILEKITSEEVITVQTKLSEKIKTILDSNDSYKVGSFDISIKDSKVKAYMVVGIYFVLIIILGDLLVGNRYTIKFLKKTINVFKKKTQKNEG